MKKVLIQVPEKRIEKLDAIVATGQFPNRNDAIREALREFTEPCESQNQINRLKTVWCDWNNRTVELRDVDTLLEIGKILFPVKQQSVEEEVVLQFKNTEGKKA